MSPDHRTLEILADALRHEGMAAVVHGDPATQVLGVAQDSRAVTPGDLFLAWQGTTHDAHTFVQDAVDRGAVAAMVERHLPEVSIPQIVVEGGQRAASILALCMHGNPESGMFRAAVTGTNGKTTVAYLVRQLLARKGPAGCLGTLGVIGAAGRSQDGTGGLTTPGPVALALALRGLQQEGVEAMAMEASSHALAQGRLDGLRFHVAAFTNLTQDHLDYHQTMDAYRDAKARLLERVLPEGEVVLNVGDAAWAGLPAFSVPVRPVWVEGAQGSTDWIRAPHLAPMLRAESLELGAEGSSFWLVEEGGDRAHVRLPLLGRFNVENALMAAGVARAAGLPLLDIAEGLATCSAPPGRMERTAVTPCPVILDYAHTPDALYRVLEGLRPLVRGRLLVVFGAGGDRDRGKRPLMAKAVEAFADGLILTSDNPRTEDPQQILDDLEAGLAPSTPRLRIEDRRTAIGRALKEAGPEDLVLVAGKGHELGQQVGHEVLPFDEREIVAEWIDELRSQRERPQPWRWEEVLEALGSPQVVGLTEKVLHPHSAVGVSTDTRALGPGHLFVALEGPRFDGHAFLAEAHARGAVAAVVHRIPDDPPQGLPLLVVHDTHEALGSLARYRREQLRAKGVTVVGITGSVGKTTTRALLEAAVGSVRKVHATRANENNQIGVPLTLLATPAHAQVVLLEMGTSMAGEIGFLTHVARPDVVLLTTVSEAHTEGLGDLEGVFVEKLSILSGRPAPQGVVVGDAPGALADRAQALMPSGELRVVGFSDGADPSWRGRRLEMNADGFWRVQVPGATFEAPVPGLHGAHNALMALAVADQLGVPLADAIRGFQEVRIPGQRSQLVRLPGGLLLVDCYNANPQSMSAALEWLATLPVTGPRIAILGSMGELGARSEAHHEAILRKANTLNLDGVVVLGAFAEAARSIGGASGTTRLVEAAGLGDVPDALHPLLAPGAAILIKGSRSEGLEKILPALEALLTPNGGEL